MTLPRPVKAVVFDMDGLLFDTERLHARAALAAAKEIGCRFEMDVFHRLVGTTEARRILLSHYGESYPFDELRVAWGRQFKLLAATELKLKSGALELLDLLDELGLPRALATSSPPRPCRAICQPTIWCNASMPSSPSVTMPTASLHLTPSSRQPSGWASMPATAWRWRIPTMASVRLRRRE
jgi:Haloacid dehalogenase-like hydrolase